MWPTCNAAAVANDRYLICCLHQTLAANLLAAIGAVDQWLRRTDRQTLYHFMILTASGVLGGIRGYTPYTNLRVFLTAYAHLSDHK